MKILGNLFENNKQWARQMNETNPGFFEKLSKQQAPEYLWIGCSDSRVPANDIVGLLPGELFVHRNIANLVVHADLNCLSVLEYAIEALKVKHVIVCGHYGCGGVKAAIEKEPHGLVDNWLRYIREIYTKHRQELDTIQDEHKRIDKLCELNVIEQVAHVCDTTVLQNAWQRGQQVSVHGWIYDISDGLLRHLTCVENPR